jgi:pentatricopeptide repeat protein
MAAMARGIVQLSIFGWNQNLTKYVKDGQPEKAMQLFHQMQHEAMSPDKFTFVQVINACAGLGALEDGRLVQDVFQCNSLVGMYAKCGNIEEAWRVSQNVVTWNARVLEHAKYGQGQKALELFRQMQQEGV